MSKHEANVFVIQKEPHPNADKLALVKTGGFTAGVRKDEFNDGDLAVLIEPDTCIPVSREEFKFLEGASYKTGEFAGYARITVRKFRGRWSEGLVVKAPAGAVVGDNLFEALALKRWDPDLAGERSHKMDGDALGVDGFSGKYDLENMLKHDDVFAQGEPVIATEKIHGSNMRVGLVNGVLHVGKRSCWVKEGESIYWRAFRNNMAAVEKLLGTENIVTVHGEAIPCQGDKWKYGQEQATMVVFDLQRADGIFLNPHDVAGILDELSIMYAPRVYVGEYDLEKLRLCAEGSSILAPGAVPCREGVVVRPFVERYSAALRGRAVLKLVGNGYLEVK